MEIAAVVVQVKQLTLRQGDVLVCELPNDWTYAQVETFGDLIGKMNVIPDGVKLLLLPQGSNLSILSPDRPSPRKDAN